MSIGTKKIRGLAVPYNALSEDLGGFKEKFLPGSLTDSLRGDVFADIEHDAKMKLARSSKGTLKLTETSKGLWAEIIPPRTTLGDDTVANVENGNLDAMSIGFAKNPDAEMVYENGQLIRIVKKASLRAVTLTAYPAYRQTAGRLSAS
jgi:uncharacterized protein